VYLPSRIVPARKAPPAPAEVPTAVRIPVCGGGIAIPVIGRAIVPAGSLASAATPRKR